MYEKKTFGIWNVMIQKRFNKKCHDVFRYQQYSLTIAMMIVLQERVYRMGVNLRFGGGDGGKTTAIGKLEMVQTLMQS